MIYFFIHSDIHSCYSGVTLGIYPLIQRYPNTCLYLPSLPIHDVPHLTRRYCQSLVHCGQNINNVMLYDNIDEFRFRRFRSRIFMYGSFIRPKGNSINIFNPELLHSNNCLLHVGLCVTVLDIGANKCMVVR